MSVVSGCDSAEVLEAAEHPLDSVAVAVENRRETVFPAPIGLWRDVRHRAVGLHLAADRIAVIALVAMQDVALGQALKKPGARRAISDIAAG